MRPGSTRSAVAAIVIAGLVVAAFAASRIAMASVPSDREYDEGVYLLSARSLLSGHRLFSEVFSSQPPAFLESLALWMRVFGDSLASARLAVLASALAAIAAAGQIARRVAGNAAAAAAAAALVSCITFVDLSHLVEAEMPAVALALASLAACLEARERGSSRAWLVFAGALFAGSALFKLIAAPFAVPLASVLVLAASEAEHEAWKLDGSIRDAVRRALPRAAFVIVGAIAVGTFAMLACDVHLLVEQVLRFQIAKREVYPLRAHINLARAARHLFENPPLAIAAAIGWRSLARANPLAAAWLGLWLLAATAAVAGQTPLFWRHFIVLTPILALAAAAGVGLGAGETGRSGRSLAAALMIAVLAWPIVRPGGKYPTLARSRTDDASPSLVHTARWIAANTAPADFVAGDDPMAIYLAGRQSPPSICDTSHARIRTGSLTADTAIAATATARIVVLRRGGRLSRLRGYREWLDQSYDRQQLPFEATPPRSAWIRERQP